MDFISTYRIVSKQLKQEYDNVSHQIDSIAVQGKLEALKKIEYFEDISKLNNKKELCNLPGLNGEYQVRQMFEKGMGIKTVNYEPSYEVKIIQKLITDFLEDKKLTEASTSLSKMSLSTAVIENTFVDFNNENFLHK